MLEQEKKWELIQQGRPDDYHGVAVHPRHLSLFERAVLKRHHQYRPSTLQLPSHTAETDIAVHSDTLRTARMDTAASSATLNSQASSAGSHDCHHVTQLPLVAPDLTLPHSSPPEPASDR